MKASLEEQLAELEASWHFWQIYGSACPEFANLRAAAIRERARYLEKVYNARTQMRTRKTMNDIQHKFKGK